MPRSEEVEAAIPTFTFALAVKLASVAVHAEELLSSDGHPADADAIRSLLADDEVRAYIKRLDAMALVPKKRY